MDREQVLDEILKAEVTVWAGAQTRVAVTTVDVIGGSFMLVYRVYAPRYAKNETPGLVEESRYLEDIVEEVLLHENRKVRFSIEGKDGDHYYTVLNANGNECATAATKADAKKIAELLDEIEDLKEKL